MTQSMHCLQVNAKHFQDSLKYRTFGRFPSGISWSGISCGYNSDQFFDGFKNHFSIQ